MPDNARIWPTGKIEKGFKIKKGLKREDARQLPLPGTYYEKVYLNSRIVVSVFSKFFNLILLYVKEMKFPCYGNETFLNLK